MLGIKWFDIYCACSVSHASKCIFIQCLTYPSVSCPSAYSFGVPHVQVSHVQVPIHSVSRVKVPIHLVSHISKCLFIRCLAPPSVYSFRVLHLQVSHVQVSHTFIRPTYPSAYSFSVSCPPSASHIRVPIHLVSHASKYPLFSVSCPSDYSFSVSRVQVPIHSVSHISECPFIRCLTPPSVYSFSVSRVQVSIHSVSHTSKCLFIQCLMPFSAPCPLVPHAL
jgi:hypothetical protein